MTSDQQSLIPALAALVIRQSDRVVQEGGIVTGVDAIPGSRTGLSPEDRRVMAAVSRELLSRGLPDLSAEIHTLLHTCAQPLGDWLCIREVEHEGYQAVRLVDVDGGVPALDAREIARRFGGYLPDQEAMLFGRFMAVLSRNFASDAPRAYTAVRSFVVRHPLATLEEIQQFLQCERLLGPMIEVVLEFYESVPLGWSGRNGVPACRHCGNAMAMRVGGRLRCRTNACAESAPPDVASHRPLDGLRRVRRSLMTYWVNPGFDEIRLFDELRQQFQDVALYPNKDEVDISVGDIGIDLKAYASPEILAERFNRGLGGLAKYRVRLVVVPDRLAQAEYLVRLRRSLEGAAQSLECLRVADVMGRVRRA